MNVSAVIGGLCSSVLLLLAGCTAIGGGHTATVVMLDSGAVMGVRAGEVTAFRGIPYAAPPVGDLRWRAPQPVQSWPGVRPAKEFAPHCAQPLSDVAGFDQQPMSEDCLTLNVLTPAVESGAALPVMVWVHGGGYSVGSGNKPRTNSAALAAEGVVLVTVNYRLSAFGFLAHPAMAAAYPNEVGANFGLQDVIAALKWVQRNAVAFGGDPTRVTVFGESAGAGLVNNLLVTPASAGLFQQAISESASVGLAPEPYLDRRAGFLPPAAKQAEKFARDLGVTKTMTDAEALAVMRSASTDAVLAVLSDRDRYTPIIDGRLLPDQVGTLLQKGQFHPVPYLTGGNSWEASLGRDIGGGFSPEFAARLLTAEQKGRLYAGMQGAALEDAIFGDLIIHSASAYVAQHMHAAGMPVYRYYLSYVADDRRGKQPGVAHEEDIAFVMQSLENEGDLQHISAADRERSALMSRYWVEFARSGNPNFDGAPNWQPYEPSSGAVLEIGDEVIMRPALFAERIDFHIDRGATLLDKARQAQ